MTPIISLSLSSRPCLYDTSPRQGGIRRGKVETEFNIKMSTPLNAATAPRPLGDSRYRDWGGRRDNFDADTDSAPPRLENASPAVSVRKSHSNASFSLAAYFKPDPGMSARPAA